MTSSAWLTFGGFAIVAGTWVQYLSTIPRGVVPPRPVGAVVAIVFGTLAAGAGFAKAIAQGADGIVVLAPAAGFAVMLGGLFLFLLSQRKTPIGDLRVEVGKPMLRVEAKTADGADFSGADLAGRRYLLKFFRGYW